MSDQPHTAPQGGARPPDASPREHRIWDPASGRWVTEAELASSAAQSRRRGRQQQPPGPPADHVASPTPAGGGAAPEAPAEARDQAPPSVAGLGRTTLPRWPAIVLAAAAGAALGVTAMLFVPGVVDREPLPTNAPPPRTFAGFDPVEVVERVRPAVVSVTIAGPNRSRPTEGARSGPGVVLGEDGTIVASASLVADATDAAVTFVAGRAVAAEVVGTDPETDLAVLRVDETALHAIPRTDTAEFVRHADEVVVVSSPSETFTAVMSGVVSSTAAPVAGPGGPLLDAITVDADRGAAAGALVAGIDGTAIGLLRETPLEGPVVVTPIDVVRTVAQRIVDGEPVEHPWIGLAATPAGESADTFELIVALVFEDGPAADAGIEPASAIVAIDGERVEGPLSLTTRLWTHRVDETMTVTLRSADRAPQTVAITVAERPSED